MQDHRIGVTQDRIQALKEKGENKCNTTPMGPDIRTHDECAENNAPCIRQISITSPRYNNRPDHMSHMTMTDECSTVDINRKSPG